MRKFWMTAAMALALIALPACAAEEEAEPAETTEDVAPAPVPEPAPVDTMAPMDTTAAADTTPAQ